MGGNRLPTLHGYHLNKALLNHWAKDRIAEADEVLERCQLPRFLEWHLALYHERLEYRLILAARFGRDVDAVQFRLAFEPESVLVNPL